MLVITGLRTGDVYSTKQNFGMFRASNNATGRIVQLAQNVYW